MTTLGWIFMTVSLTCVWGGAFWCFRTVLKTPEEEKTFPGYGP